MPTIVFELDSPNLKCENINEVFDLSNRLSSKKIAKSIIVLGDPTYIFCIPTYRLYRKNRYLWIPDFSEDDANDYLTKLNFTKDDKIRKKVFDELGTRPLTLINLVLSNEEPDDFIAKGIRYAMNEIKSSLILHPNQKNILKEMIKDENRNGMKIDQFRKIFTEKELEIAVKLYRIFDFNLENQMIIFDSQSKYRAAKRLYEKFEKNYEK